MKRTKWDYLVSHTEEELTPLGQEGWELVSVVPVPDGKACRFYYKRPAASGVQAARPGIPRRHQNRGRHPLRQYDHRFGLSRRDSTRAFLG